MSKEAMKLALEALTKNSDRVTEIRAKDQAITALREALEKEALHKLAAESLNEGLRLDDWPKIVCVNHDCDKCKTLAEQPAQQEPVAVVEELPIGEGNPPFKFADLRDVPTGTKLYTTPQQSAQQDIPDLIAGALGVSRGTAYEMMREALAEASPPDPCCWPGTSCDAQQEPVATLFGTLPVYDKPAPDYAWPTIADYEKEVGFKVNDAFRAAWTMARTTNDLFKQMGSDT